MTISRSGWIGLLTLVLPALAGAQEPAKSPQAPQGPPPTMMQAVVSTLQQQRNRASAEAQDALVSLASLQAQVALEREWWTRWWAGTYPKK